MVAVRGRRFVILTCLGALAACAVENGSTASLPPLVDSTASPGAPSSVVVGRSGPPGERGPAGEKGDPGPIGPRGPAGPTGPAGQTGEVGPAGVAGVMGAPGPAGTPGPRGSRGSRGTRGPEGPVGPIGPIGPAGPAGADGIDGTSGADGTDGIDGAPGTDGASAYDLWLADGNVGTLSDFWNWLRAGAWGYGSFIDTTTQSNPVANTARPITFDTTLESDGISISGGSNIEVAETGVYNVQFSAEITKTDTGIDYVDIWFVLNGTAIPWSNTRLTLSDKNDSVVAAWNYILTMTPTDQLQLFWSSPDTSISIPSITGLTNPVRPNIPSLILTVYRMR